VTVTYSCPAKLPLAGFMQYDSTDFFYKLCNTFDEFVTVWNSLCVAERVSETGEVLGYNTQVTDSVEALPFL
jgi:hypothetical protein